MKKYKPGDLDDYEIDGVDARDYPDFCDSFLAWAVDKNGKELSDIELEYVSETYPEWINELAFESLL